MPVKYMGILIIIFGRGRGFDSQPEGLEVFWSYNGLFVLGLIMYILTTLEFPKHNHDFHLLTTRVEMTPWG